MGISTSRVLSIASVFFLACGTKVPPPLGFGDEVVRIDAGAGTDAIASLTGDDDGSNADCPDNAKLVYVTGEGSQLYSFDPSSVKFTLIGTLDCLPDGPTHMTVDRHGVAWVVSDGLLFTASTTDASCAMVDNFAGDDPDFEDFALTFVGTTAAPDDALYLLSATELGKFDPNTGTLTHIAQAPANDSIGDMTSNEDGTLYFLWDQQTDPLTLYQLSPANGAVLSTEEIDVLGGGSQALAYWGGHFYAFENDVIYDYDPVKTTITPLGNAPLEVTGAGQSTCVPTTQPPPR